MFIPMAQAAGVIDDALSAADILTRVLDFLLQIAGTLGIIGIVLAGMLYFFAGGDRHRIALAKKVFVATIVGSICLFAALIFLKEIQGWFA